ncbi:MAG: choice-of-anchor Q domain-containing protein [Saprospiraceae bacterium]|nr:choice-of-anchor Q domain-containing protein [Saprospiraceae bacterium]
MKKNLLPFALIAFCLVMNKTEAQWTSMGSGISVPQRTLAGIAPVNENILWGFTWHSSQFVPTHEYTRTTDGGQTWQSGTLTSVSSDQYSIYIFPLDGQTAWLTTADEKNPIKGKIYKTTDGGTSWTHQATGFTGVNETPAGIYFWNANEGMAYGATHETTYNNQISVYTTTDGGNQWTKVVAPNMPAQLPGEGQGIYNFAGFFSVVGDTVWFGTTKKRVFRSADRGKSWQVFSTPLTNSSFISSIGFRNCQTGLALGDISLKLARSTDGGETWALLPLTVPANFRGAQIEYVPGTRSTWIMVTGPTNYMVTYNDGDTWETFDSNIEVWSMEFLDAKTGFAASYITSPTQGGAYRWSGLPLGNRLFVNDDAVGANNGASWADAYTDLKSALTTASEGDQIWVAAGTYKPAASGGASTATFTLNKNLQLLGGFAGTETSAGQRDPVANPTVLSGDLNGNDVDDDFSAATRSDNVQHVLSITSSVSKATIIDGFNIDGGHADGAPSNGGGVFSSGSPKITRCTFRQNYATGGGGALRQNASPGTGIQLENCLFEKNRANFGAAVSLFNSAFHISGCDFMGNSTFDGTLEGNAGGIYTNNSSGKVINCRFKDNHAFEYGGAVFVWAPSNSSGAEVEVLNCAFENNLAEIQGGGLIFAMDGNNTSLLVDNCFFFQNSARGGSGLHGVQRGNGGAFVLSNSTFSENYTSDTIFYYAVAGIYSANAANGTTVVDNCIFKDNIAASTGGLDIGCLSSGDEMDFTISNCSFLNNYAYDYCGGFDLFAAKGSFANFLVENCLVEGNSAGKGNGGVWIDVTSSDFKATFRNCRILDNHSPTRGAFDFFQHDIGELAMPTGSQLILENCLIAGNSSSDAVLVVDSFPDVQLLNCTVSGNSGGGIQLSDKSGLSLQNTILYNPGYPDYRTLTNDVSFSSNGGNLIGDLSLDGQLLPSDKQNLDPLFLGAGDYRLGAGSPCIDMGVDLGNLSELDLDGNARVSGAGVDIGAYEHPTSTVMEVIVGELTVSPNPAVAFLTVKLPEEITGTFVVEVYDTEGKLLRRQTLIEGQRLDVEGFEVGLYTLKVVVGERVFVGKFVKG